MKITIVLRKNKQDASGKCPLYLRISKGNKRKEIYTGEKILPANWDNKHQVVLNDQMLTIRLQNEITKFSKLKNKLIVNDEKLDIASIKRIMAGDDKKGGIDYTLANYIKNVVEEASNLKFTSRKTYRACRLNIEEYDPRILLSDIDGDWMISFDNWLRSTKKFADWTVHSRLKCVKAALKRALDNGIIKELNISKYKIVRGNSELKYMTVKELKQFMDYEPTTALDKNIKRAFVWSCFAGGMRFGDVLTLQYNRIRYEFDGDNWNYTLKYKMRKTGNPVEITLNDNALQQIDTNQVGNDNLVFGLIKQTDLKISPDDLSYKLEKRNAYINKRLKEIQKRAGLRRTFSFHKSRATHICIGLEMGIDVMTLTSLAGLKDVAVLQKHYAEAVDKRKKEAMAKFDSI